MCRSLQIAPEAKDHSMAITYNLAIAKIAIQIKKEESLVYTIYLLHFVYFM